MRAIGLLAFLLVALPASAEQFLFEGTLGLRGLGDPAPIATAVGVATVNGSAGAGHLSTLQLPGGLFTLMSTSTSPTSSTTPLITKLVVSITPGAGTFAGGGAGTLAGVLPVPGNLRVCALLPNCGFPIDIPFTSASGALGVGIGGTITQTVLSTLTLSLVGYDWAAVTRSIATSGGVVTTPGFAHGPLSGTSSTAQTSGLVRLNSPIPVAFRSGGGPVDVIPLFATLEVRFLPEPRAFALLASGAAALALLGWRRARRAPR